MIDTTEPVWTMSAARYQHLAGVHQPWIAEISPMQYAHLSKRGKVQYDAKRSAEWQASADCKERYALEVIAAYDAGLFDPKAPDTHRDAEQAVWRMATRRKEKAQAERFDAMRKENRITDLSTLSVGQRVFSIMAGRYGTVAKINRKSVIVRFDELIGHRCGHEWKCAAGSIDHLSHNDLKTASEQEPACTT